LDEFIIFIAELICINLALILIFGSKSYTNKIN